VAFTQSQLLTKEVFLVDKLTNQARDGMKHMKAICFMRPTPDAIQALVEELRHPLYAEYHLCKFGELCHQWL
jgi:hypothetical protein